MTTLVSLSQEPILRFVDDDGNALVGGQLTTLVGGVMYPTYSDAQGQFQLPNPIVLNDRGEVATQNGTSTPLWLDPTATYTFILQDAQLNTIWTAPNIVSAATEPVVISLINSTVTAAFIGALLYPQTQAEQNASVIPSIFTYLPGQPERYMLPGFTYPTSSTDSTSSDFSGAINTALGIELQPVSLQASRYLIKSTLTVPSETKMYGQGNNQTALCCAPGFTGPVITWDGISAAKISLSGFGVYCNHIPSQNLFNSAITVGIVLGINTAPFGTEPDGFGDVLVRDLPSSIKALDLFCNIAEMGNLYALNTGGIQILGSGFSVENMENTNCSGFTETISGNNNVVGTALQDGIIKFYEMEAPQSNIILVYYIGNSVIEYFVPSFATGTVFTELVYIGSSAGTWILDLAQIYFSGPVFATFQAVFGDQATDSLYGPGSTSTTATSHAAVNFYRTGIYTTGNTFAIKKQPLTNFALLISNSTGTLQHRITAAGQNGVTSIWTSTITGDSITPVATPTVGPSTDFASGGGILTGFPYLFVVNSGAEAPTDTALFASIDWSLLTTGNNYRVRPTLINTNINGTTQNWLAFQLTDATLGTNVNWLTALTTSGNFIEVSFLGFIR